MPDIYCPEQPFHPSDPPEHRAGKEFGDKVVTLGPTGTDAEAVAHQLFTHVELAESFNEAMQIACLTGICALVPAGYLERDRTGIHHSWVDLHFSYSDRLQLIRLWEQPTKEMCLAINSERFSSISEVKSLAIHPATLVFARRYLPHARITYVRAKPLAARMAAAAHTDACIASLDVVQQEKSLRPVLMFTPTMIWCLYSTSRREPPTGEDEQNE
ncbi:hypothetical protein [Streptomyces hokutonensis]|uniref:Prephenate dehydratase n=1 Tax=Streptomyces hokutonensis TaxID=1306990 RepID=A0ABW6MMU0_9ACTN